MAYTYAQYVTELAILAGYDPADPNFNSNIPSCLDYAQDRIGRELNLLNSVSTNYSLTTTGGSRLVSLIGINVNVLENINIVTPVGAVTPDSGARNPLVIQNKAWLDWTFGSSLNSSIPQYFALLDDKTILLGPWPDHNYMVEVVGTYRQPSLSATNTTTWVSTYLPDLLMAASMIQLSGFKMNFGAMSDDPQQAQSWEKHYLSLRDSAAAEDARRKFYATGWTSDMPSQFNTART